MPAPFTMQNRCRPLPDDGGPQSSCPGALDVSGALSGNADSMVMTPSLLSNGFQRGFECLFLLVT